MPGMVQIVWHDMGKAQEALSAKAAAASKGSRTGVMLAARAIEASVKRETPVLTGTLRRSIHVEGPEPFGVGGWMAQVGPSEVYGRRVELGFHGTDSLGRKYDQDGNPYMERGFARVAPQLPEVFAGAWAEAMGL
jgi:hypothetical protein